jgi:hypothetical protein
MILQVNQFVRAMKRLGLVERSSTGTRLPADIPLRELGL